MSSGSFLVSKYQCTKVDGAIVNIRVQPETLTLTLDGTENDPPPGAIEAGYPSAQVSKGARSLGINARMAYVVFTGSPPAGYKAGSAIGLPILTTALWAKVGKGVTGTYNVGGTPQPVRVAYFRDEKVN